MACRSSGLFLLKKLKLEHVHMTSYSRMRVSLAAQVAIVASFFANLQHACFVICRCSVKVWRKLLTIMETLEQLKHSDSLNSLIPSLIV